MSLNWKDRRMWHCQSYTILYFGLELGYSHISSEDCQMRDNAADLKGAGKTLTPYCLLAKIGDEENSSTALSK
jgi:hypothetical protein